MARPPGGGGRATGVESCSHDDGACGMMQFERWSLLIVAEAMLRGTRRIRDFQRYLGLAPETLRLRLNGLVQAGIMDSVAAADGTPEYVLTAKGDDLSVAIRALDGWSREWDPLATPTTAETDAIEDPASEGHEPPSGLPVAVEIFLLGGFRMRVGGIAAENLATGSQRLLVFLALHDRAIARIVLAGTMWPDVSDERAGISLRSALARLDPITRDAIQTGKAGGLGLGESVTVDLRDAVALAHRLLQEDGVVEPTDLDATAVATLSRELLPDWYDDWIVAEAEDWRHLRMNALEALAQRLLGLARLREAIGAARAAMRIDPLRESPHAMLIRIHLADGNQSEALGVFDRYREMLHTALDLEPTANVSQLVADIRR